MTVRPKNILDTSDSSFPSCQPPSSVDEPLENFSPPNKRLRLSLKGQQFLGSINHSKKGKICTRCHLYTLTLILTQFFSVILKCSDNMLHYKRLIMSIVKEDVQCVFTRKSNLFTYLFCWSVAFQATKADTSPRMQNIRPNLLDPMSLHVSYTGSGVGLMTPTYNRMDTNGELDVYERERERPARLDPSSNEKPSLLPPVATLLNLGNTCFLNSVLYTLRFTPGFAHLLHHLAADLTDIKLLSSSMGTNERKIGFLSSGSPGLRTKSLTSLTPSNVDETNVQMDAVKRKTLVLTERLHELLQTLHNAEQKGDLGEPFQADAFLQALREVNPLFQGNQQQDAHELLVCSLDYLREACQLVDKAQNKSLDESLEIGIPVEQSNIETGVTRRGKQNSDKKKKSKKIFAEKEKDVKKGKRGAGNAFSNSPPNSAVEQDQVPTVNLFIL